MPTHFHTLSTGWNAEPNAPNPEITLEGTTLHLSFELNPWQFPQFKEGDWATLTFTGCARYRLGPTNDEGWSRGQCRFSHLAPAWGEFYQVTGDLLLDRLNLRWHTLSPTPAPNSQHFLFYFRDNTFECTAQTSHLTLQTTSHRRSFDGLP